MYTFVSSIYIHYNLSFIILASLVDAVVDEENTIMIYYDCLIAVVALL